MSSDRIRCQFGSLLPVIIAALLAIGAGCRLLPAERKIETKVHAQEDIAATQNQVRLRMRALVGPMCGQIEQTADSIIAGTTNGDVRQAALRWKIEGVPALRQALFQPDPFTALSDTWVLCFQMVDYFEKGPGKEALGAASAQAAATCRSMEEEFAQVAASVTISGDVSKARAFAREWAANHPIRHSIADRESILSRVLERDMPGTFTTGEAAVEVITTLDDVNRRLEIYSDQLFRQARWEIDLLKTELPVDEALPLAERAVKSAEQAVATMDRLAPHVERAMVVAENAPTIIAAEREATVMALSEELSRTMKFIQKERIASLERLIRERITASKEMHEAVIAERKALTRDMEHISLKVVDHAMWRAAQLVAATVAVVLLATLAGLFIVRKMFFPQTSRTEPRQRAG